MTPTLTLAADEGAVAQSVDARARLSTSAVVQMQP
jgi:hypothetical protein